MGLSADEVSFLDEHHSAAMITVAADGTVKAVRVGVALVDGKLWSSGISGRVRTRRRERPAARSAQTGRYSGGEPRPAGRDWTCG